MAASSVVVREDEKLSKFTSIPFFLLHLSLLVPIWTGVRWEMVALLIFTYYLRMFGITAGYHRYFSHRAFKTSRVFQFILAFLAQSSAQKGALWWAANHRHHHKFSDQPEDIHSPVQRGFWWSHVGWILCKRYENTDYAAIKDFAKYPELVFLDKYPHVASLGAGAIVFLIGGWEALLWGGLISTVVLWHGTFTINSLSHVFGSRRYQTTDTSRNNFLLAMITMGEGWHNNHHHYQSTANQGFFWWEIDMTYYILKVLSWFGIVWDLRKPPQYILENRPKHENRPTHDDAPVGAEVSVAMPVAAAE